MNRVTLVLLAAAALAVAERPGDFRIIGPGGGGAMFHPTFSPHDVNTALINCDMTGAYITHDGGRSWRMFNLRGVVRFFAFDPSSPRTIYAHSIGLFRSTDNGDTWNLVWPKPSAIRGIEMNSDHAEETIVADNNPIGPMTALAVDPKDSRTLVAGSKQGLFVSHDAGNSWTKETDVSEPPQRILIQNRDMYVAGRHGIKARRDGKWNEWKSPDGVAFADMSGGIPGTGDPVFYAVAGTRALVSRNGGSSWDALTLPGAGANMRAVAASLQHPEVAYISYNQLSADGAKWFGVARTGDAGRTWNLVWKENNSKPGANIHDAWITESLGPSWGENPLMLGVADQDPNVAFGTDFGRALLTTDGGQNWNATYSKRVAGAGWTTTGLDVTTNYGYFFDPFDSRRRFITYTDIGLMRSEDAGRSWTRSVNGVPRAWTNTTYWLAFDPDVKGRVWGVMSYTHDLPRPKMWRRADAPSRYKGGVCISDDGGRTWRKSNAGMAETGPTHIILDPTSPKDHRVLYVAAMGRGVYKSTDGGATWALKNNGITQANPFAWRLARAGDGTLYVLIARRSDDGSIGNDGDGAIYKSSDSAESWQPVGMPAGVNGPNGLAIDPKDPRRLYLATWGRATGARAEGGGIFLSTDGGKTWRNVLDRDRHVYDVTIDPRDAKLLYACGFESSAWRSTDAGEHWTRIPGYNFKWGHRVVPDPEDRNQVYITTFGGSVWHGAVNGPNRPVDIVTPELEPGK